MHGPAVRACGGWTGLDLFPSITPPPHHPTPHNTGIRAFPTFRLYHNSQVLDEIQGANIPAVEAAVQRHRASLPAAAFSGSGTSLGGGGSGEYIHVRAWCGVVWCGPPIRRRDAIDVQ